MTTTYGIDCRATAGYVTDPGGFTYWLGESFPTTRGGLTFGSSASGGGAGPRDRTTSNDPRLAGLCFGNNSGGPSILQITLPQAGAWTIAAAFGDASSASAQFFSFYDGSTLIGSVQTNIGTAANSFADAAGNVWTAAAWPGSNVPISHTFAGTTLNVHFGDPAGSSAGVTGLANITLVYTPPAGPTINTQPTNQTAKIGATATFTAAATSSGTGLAAQWQKNATNISGATNPTTYTTPTVALGDHGATFDCVYTDSNGSVTTSAAALTVAVTFSGTVGSQSGTVGTPYSLDLSSYFAGGLSRTYSVLSGALPAGITQTGTTAAFSGTPTTAGSGSFVVRATDSAGNHDDTNSISWTIASSGGSTPVSFSGTVPGQTGVVGSAFSLALASYFSGSLTPFTYSVLSGALPGGLSLNTSTGAITGTPTTAGGFSAVIRATDTGSNMAQTGTVSWTISAATLSAPAVNNVATTTATVGFNTDTLSGTAYYLRRNGTTPALAAAIIAGGESQAVGGANPQARNATAFTAGLTYYVDMVQVTAGGTSNVVSAGPFYPGTGRPVSDVSVAGWTPSAGGSLAAMLFEDTADDSTYITSPSLSGVPSVAVMALDKTYPAGTYPVKVRAAVNLGTGTLRVKLIDNSGTVLGVTPDQALSTVLTTYTLNVTTTGSATRMQVEVST